MSEKVFYHPHSDNIVAGHAAFVAHEIEGSKDEAVKLGITYSMDVQLYKQVGYFIETPFGISFMNKEFVDNNFVDLDVDENESGDHG